MHAWRSRPPHLPQPWTGLSDHSSHFREATFFFLSVIVVFHRLPWKMPRSFRLGSGRRG